MWCGRSVNYCYNQNHIAIYKYSDQRVVYRQLPQGYMCIISQLKNIIRQAQSNEKKISFSGEKTQTKGYKPTLLVCTTLPQGRKATTSCLNDLHQRHNFSVWWEFISDCLLITGLFQQRKKHSLMEFLMWGGIFRGSEGTFGIFWKIPPMDTLLCRIRACERGIPSFQIHPSVGVMRKKGPGWGTSLYL